MIMKLLLSLIFGALLFASAANAQSYEYGKPSELKGLTKVFIEAGLDLTNRNRIAEVLEKELPDLKIVDSEEEAEFGIIFAGAKQEKVTGSIQGAPIGGIPQPAIVTRRKEDVGKGLVAIPKANGKPARPYGF